MKEFKNPPIHESEDSITPTIKEYLKKRNIEAHITQVSLFEGVRIEIDPNEQDQVLITEKLNGCTATIIYTEHADKTCSAQLAHFPPFMLARHLEKITSLINQDDIDASQKHVLIYLQSKRKENEDEIISDIKRTLGENVSMVVEYYDKEDESDIVGIEIKQEEVIYHIGAKDVVIY
jgi:hypothetical protein